MNEMIIPQGDGMLEMLRLKKYGGGKYSIRYRSFLTGGYKVIPVTKTGVFHCKDDATSWARANLREYLVKEVQMLERQTWRSNLKVLQLYNSYAEWRKEDQPRSAQQDLSMLINYGIPFFAGVLKEEDPNKWCEFGEELLEWLRKEARTKKEEPLAVSSCNKVINSLNHFVKWMVRKKHISYANARPFECIDQRKTNRRTEKDLVTDEVFDAVYNHISRQKNGKLYADMWKTQRACGFRVSELLGLTFHWLSDECPAFIKEDFVEKGLKVYGSIYLESQPAKPYVKRVNGVIPRTPLKWRDSISPDNARTVPILSKEVWDLLVERYDVECEKWEKKTYGLYKDSYLLFDGAQRNIYLRYIQEANASLGLKGDGSHILRHTLSTEWSLMRIEDKVKELVLGHKDQARKSYDHFAGKINAERAKAAPMRRLRKVG
ncbi:MAG: hypothetical protein H7318_14160 [Oligoflexus sp.]|nr:hypothetical protein [Oligoflexus sp.]